MQLLHSLGYSHTAKFLGRMSGFSYIYQPKKFENLRTQFVNGFWDKCADTLHGIDSLDENTVSEDVYLTFQQWLLKSLALNRSEPVSNVLRKDFFYCLKNNHILRLAALMAKFPEMNPYGYIDSLNELSCVVELRKLMFKKLEALLPVEVAMLDNRLLVLFESGYSAQICSCLSHNAESEISLLPGPFMWYRSIMRFLSVELRTPRCAYGVGKTKMCLWFWAVTVRCVSWSPERPQMLASASDDGTIRIWGPRISVAKMFRIDDSLGRINHQKLVSDTYGSWVLVIL